MYFYIVLILIIALIVWKLIYDFTVMLFFIPIGLIIFFLGFFIKEDSRLGGFLLMLAGVAAIVLSIINRDMSIGVFVDGIPNMIMFWK